MRGKSFFWNTCYFTSGEVSLNCVFCFSGSHCNAENHPRMLESKAFCAPILTASEEITTEAVRSKNSCIINLNYFLLYKFKQEFLSFFGIKVFRKKELDFFNVQMIIMRSTQPMRLTKKNSIAFMSLSSGMVVHPSS